MNNSLPVSNLYKIEKGFTLIELLIVIAIIGLLVSLAGFGLQGARESARDSKRMADLESIRSALEIYRSDCNKYPASLTYGSPLSGDGSSGCPVSNVYLEKVPQDSVTGRTYSYTPSGSPATTYTLCAALESAASAVTGCGSCTATCSYKVTNP